MPEPTDIVALDHENWSPIGLLDLKVLLDQAARPWWVAGGMAVDLFLGRMTREHHDVDVAILRVDQLAFQRRLSQWDLMIPTGEWEAEPFESRALFRPWIKGQVLARGEGQAWCRRTSEADWAFELLLAEGEAGTWRFKKDLEISRSIEEVGSTTSEGIPHLAPEIVLLHKATSSFPGEKSGRTRRESIEKDLAREHAEQDIALLLSSMDDSQRKWLGENLRRVKPAHKWLDRL